ncbi:lipopolysaccharide assembly protein LapA domain-containing protein [Sphingomonas faeni]|uniref:lipopolysaccharide assembly protein LapA domain-containing protein n=1 Tax=Sphingomonas faeni TaxID=185950 RepID=UPI0033491170
MQFLKILFWCLLAFVAAVFTISNWNPVQIQLWGGLVADVNLPLLLLVTFLIGFVPTLLYNHAIRWRLRQRLATCERSLTELRMPRTDVTPVPVVDVPIAPAAAPTVPLAAATAPLAAPTAVPPGVA